MTFVDYPALGWIVALCFAIMFLAGLAWLLTMVINKGIRDAAENHDLSVKLREREVEIERLKSQLQQNPVSGRRPSREQDVYANLQHMQIHAEKLLVGQTGRMDRIDKLMHKILENVRAAEEAGTQCPVHDVMVADLNSLADQIRAEASETRAAYAKLISEEAAKVVRDFPKLRVVEGTSPPSIL